MALGRADLHAADVTPLRCAFGPQAEKTFPFSKVWTKLGAERAFQWLSATKT